MIPKMTACLEAVAGGVPKAAIIDGVSHIRSCSRFSRSRNRNGGSANDLERVRVSDDDQLPSAATGSRRGLLRLGLRGSVYLDFLAGIAVNSLGHAHPALVAAVSTQVATLAHVSNYFATHPQLELAERLCGSPVRTGSSSVIRGRKRSRRPSSWRAEPGRPRILSLTNSFHGRTMGRTLHHRKASLARAVLSPWCPGPSRSTPLSTRSRQPSERTSLIIVEPIKGEAGVIELPDHYLEEHGLAPRGSPPRIPLATGARRSQEFPADGRRIGLGATSTRSETPASAQRRDQSSLLTGKPYRAGHPRRNLEKNSDQSAESC